MRTIAEADLEAVRAFLAVVEHGSYRGAARALGVGKSTLSQRVAVLEEQLGARLLNRTTRSVQLTDIGRRYQAEAAPAMQALRAAEAQVVAAQSRPAGKLRMTTPAEMGQRWLGDLLSTFGARCPDVQVEVQLLDRQVNLVEEGFDLALRVGPLDDSALIARPLGKPQCIGVFASPDYLAHRGTPSHPRELASHRCLVMTGAREPSVWRFRGARRTLSVPVHAHVAVNHFGTLSQLAVAGLGVTRLPEDFARPHVRAGRLRELLVDFALPPRRVHAVYPSARHVSPALRAMLDMLEARFGHERASRQG